MYTEANIKSKLHVGKNVRIFTVLKTQSFV